MNDTKTIKLLNEIYQSSKTAVDAINILITRTDSVSFQEMLKQQKKIYYQIADASAENLLEYNTLPGDNIMNKLEVWSAVRLATFTNRNTEYMAEIMINGSTMGMVDMKKTVVMCEGASAEAMNLASRLIHTEQENIELMMGYL